MKISIKFILYLLIVVLISSCKKETPYFPVSQEMKEYFSFKEGSYWIYDKNGISAADSSYVLKNLSVDTKDWIPGKEIELIITYLQSSFLYDFYVGYSRYGPNTFEMNYVFYLEGWQNEGSYVLDSVQHHYKYLPTETINNKIYQKVKMLTIKTKDSWFELHVAKNIGIIKFDFSSNSDTSRFSLTRYKIIQ